MESKLFESQIISLVLCFLDQHECGRLEYTSKRFDSHLNGLEFPTSLNLGRLNSFSDYLNWVISRRIKFTMFYGGFYINDVFMDRTTVQKFANIILHSTNSAKIKLSSQADWKFFFNYLHEEKPSNKLRRIVFENCCLPPYFDFGVLFDLFSDLNEFALDFRSHDLYSSASPSPFPADDICASMGRLRSLENLKKIEIRGDVHFHLPQDFIYSKVLEWRSLLEFSAADNDLIRDDFIDELTKCSINVEVLKVQSCCKVTQLSIHLIARRCKLLRYVQVSRCWFCAMNTLYKNVRLLTQNFQLPFSPNTFLLPCDEHHNRDTFPIGCIVTFGCKLVLIVDSNLSYMSVKVPPTPPVLTHLIDLTNLTEL
jgi:hypothetical protein